MWACAAYLKENGWANTEDCYTYMRTAASTYLSVGKLDTAFNLFILADSLGREIQEISYMDRLKSARGMAKGYRRASRESQAVALEALYGIDYLMDIKIPPTGQSFQRIDERIAYLTTIGDSAQIHDELKRLPYIAKKYYGEGSAEHLAGLERFVKTSYAMEGHREVETAAITYLKSLKKEGKEFTDDYLEMQRYLKKIYTAAELEANQSHLRKALPDMNTVTKLRELLPIIQENETASGEKPYDLDEVKDIRYFSKLYLRYLELATQKRKTKSGLYALILDRAVDDLLPQGRWLPQKEEQLKAWFSEQRDKWAAVREASIIATQGKGSWAYVRAKTSEIRVMHSYQKKDESLATFIQTYELARGFPNQDTAALADLILSSIDFFDRWADNPLSTTFFEKYSSEIVMSDWGARFARKFSYKESINKTIVNQRAIERYVQNISYPNLLDSSANNFKAADEFATYYHKRLNVSYLEQCLPAQEMIVTNNGFQDEDALTSYVAYNHERNPSLVGDLLNFSIRQQQFATMLRERKSRQAKVEDHPRYRALVHQWEPRRQRALEIGQSGSSQLLVRKNELDRLACELILGSWSPDKLTDWKALHRNLDKHQALVTIHRYLERINGKWNGNVAYAAVVLTPDGDSPLFVPIPGGDSLDYEFFDTYYREIRADGKINSYSRYWEPIAKKLEDINEIFYVPDGIYNRINPATLYVSSSRYLNEDIAIHQLSHAALLSYEPKELRAIKSALLLGNPRYGMEAKKTEWETDFFRSEQMDGKRVIKWAPLPHSKLEVDQIGRRLAAQNVTTTILTKEDATEASLKQMLDKPEVIHFATHAYFIPRNYTAGKSGMLINFMGQSNMFKNIDVYPAMYKIIRDGQGRYSDRELKFWIEQLKLGYEKNGSDQVSYQNIEDLDHQINTTAGLVLAGANEPTVIEDGLLTLGEIARMDLANTKLVVLSACNSGKADLLDFGGTAGLRGAFQSAGVSYVINTLWPVRDDVARSFMEAFYRNWLSEKQPIESAFNQTQLEIAGGGLSPYLWGGFILVRLK